MMLRRFALAIGVLVVLGPAPALAQKGSSAADIGDKQRDLQQTQKRLGEERAKAAEARRREAGILAELEAVDRRLTDKRNQVAQLDGKIKRAQAATASYQAEIARLQGQRVGQEDALDRRLRTLYKLQMQGGVLPMLLSGDDPAAQAIQLRRLTALA